MLSCCYYFFFFRLRGVKPQRRVRPGESTFFSSSMHMQIFVERALCNFIKKNNEEMLGLKKMSCKKSHPRGLQVCDPRSTPNKPATLVQVCYFSGASSIPVISAPACWPGREGIDGGQGVGSSPPVRNLFLGKPSSRVAARGPLGASSGGARGFSPFATAP